MQTDNKEQKVLQITIISILHMVNRI